MEHKNINIADSDASEVVAQGTKITSVSPGSTPADQRPAATDTSFQGWKPPAHEQQSSGDKPSPLLSSALFSFASSSAPAQFQFPPPASAPPASAGFNPPSVLFPSFGGSAPAFGCSTGGATAASLPTFGCTSSSATGGSAAASAQAFGCSSSSAAAAGSPAFGCSQQESLFATPDAATATRTACPFSFTINAPGVPAGFFHGFNQQVQCRTMPGCRHPWANSGLPLNAKRCYCGKVAGVRFSNTTDGTLGLFYCCPDYNEEAIRSGTQDRNYCTYTEWSNGGFSLVRKCYCGKVAVLQKSEKFGTWGKLFYSCPEYREKETVLLFGQGNRGQYCPYIEWSSSSPATAPAPAPAPQAPAVQFFG